MYCPTNIVYSIVFFTEKEDDEDVQSEIAIQEDDEDRATALKDSVRSKLQAGRSKNESKKSKKDNQSGTKNFENPAKDEEVVISDSDSDGLHNELERERRIKKKKAA